MSNEETKKQNPENEPIINLLAGLKRVEAPKDFDFRVRARIAKGRPTERATSWLPASVRYAVPLALLVMIVGYVGFYGLYSPDQANVPVVATAPAPKEEAATPRTYKLVPIENTLQPDEIVAERADTKKQPELDKPADLNDVASKRPVKPVPVRDPKAERPAGGSFVEASTQPTAILPSGANSNANDPNRSIEKVELSANEFLRSFGVNVGIGGTIQSLSGPAEAVGFKSGDVIESVNSKSGIVRIRREGTSILLQIR